MAIRIPQRQVMPSGETANAVAANGIYNREFAANTQMQRQVTRAAGTLSDISMMIQRADMDKEKNQFAGMVNQMNADQEREMTENTFVNDKGESQVLTHGEYHKRWDDRLKEIDKAALAMKHPHTQQWARNYIDRTKPLWSKNVDKYVRREQVQEISAAGMENINQIIMQDQLIDVDAANAAEGPQITERQLKEARIQSIIDTNVETNIWSPQQGQRLAAGAIDALDRAEIARVEQAVENIKPTLVETMQSGDTWSNDKRIGAADKRAAMSVAETALDQMLENDMITPAQAVDYQKDLNNWIDNYAQEYKATTEKAEKETQLKIESDLIAKMPGKGVTYADIASSGLSASKQKLWNEYLADSYTNPAPRENTTSGLKETVGAVIDVALLRMSPQDAIDTLLEERYVDHSITDDQLRWAVDKIENPYPKHMVPDIRATLNDNISEHNRTWSKDAARNNEVNEALLAWVDDQLAQDKKPTRSEMHGISSQYRIDAMDIPRLLDFGQIVTRGDRDYEVVGFTDDGDVEMEPIEEPIKTSTFLTSPGRTNNYALRNDGITYKQRGWLGPQVAKNNNGWDFVATEYSVQSNAVKVNGERIDFPTLVPTLTDKEVKQMMEDIIPNKKRIPEPIMRKAIDHANKQLRKGESVFWEPIE